MEDNTKKQDKDKEQGENAVKDKELNTVKGGTSNSPGKRPHMPRKEILY